MPARRSEDQAGIWGKINRFLGRDIVKIVLTIIITFLVTFALKTFVIVPMPGDYVTKGDFNALSLTLRNLDATKVEDSAYRTECNRIQRELDSKADKTTVEEMGKNVGRLLDVALNPAKIPQVRAEVMREKQRKSTD